MPLMISKQQMAQYVDGINVRLFLIYWHSHCLLLVQMNQLMLACVVLTACVTFLNALKCYVGSGETIEEKECSGSCFTSTQSMKGLRMGLWSQYTSLLSSSFTFHCNSVRLTCCVKRLLDLTSSRPTYSKYTVRNGEHDCVHVNAKGASFWISALNIRFFTEPPNHKNKLCSFQSHPQSTEENVLHFTCLVCGNLQGGVQEYN